MRSVRSLLVVTGTMFALAVPSVPGLRRGGDKAAIADPRFSNNIAAIR